MLKTGNDDQRYNRVTCVNRSEGHCTIGCELSSVQRTWCLSRRRSRHSLGASPRVAYLTPAPSCETLHDGLTAAPAREPDR